MSQQILNALESGEFEKNKDYAIDPHSLKIITLSPITLDFLREKVPGLIERSALVQQDSSGGWVCVSVYDPSSSSNELADPEVDRIVRSILEEGGS